MSYRLYTTLPFKYLTRVNNQCFEHFLNSGDNAQSERCLH